MIYKGFDMLVIRWTEDEKMAEYTQNFMCDLRFSCIFDKQ
jgi:hypothetical protein